MCHSGRLDRIVPHNWIVEGFAGRFRATEVRRKLVCQNSAVMNIHMLSWFSSVHFRFNSQIQYLNGESSAASEVLTQLIKSEIVFMFR